MQRQNLSTDPIPVGAAYCLSCVSVTGADMLTGYCITACRCDRCGRVSDLALVAARTDAAAKQQAKQTQLKGKE